MSKKIFKKIILSLAIVFLPLLFYWQFFLKGLIPAPADIIVGMYYPWRNYIWNNLFAGVPFKNGLISDVVAQLYPWRLLASSQWRAGNIPLWNPYILGGLPLAGNVQTAVFYPVNFIFYLLPSPITWGLTIIFQSLLAFIFAYIFLKEVGLSGLTALFGSLAFAFNGFFLFWLEWGNLVAVCSWLPLCLWAITKIAQKEFFTRQVKFWLVLLFAVSMAILAGHFQMAFLVGLASFIYALTTKKAKIVLGVIGVGFLALALTSFQVLPALEAYRLSIRDTEGIMEQYNYGFIQPANLITFLAPDFFGNPGTGNWWAFGKGIELSPYVGLTCLTLFVYFLQTFNRKSKLDFFVLLLTITALIFLFPNPISYLIYRHPKVNIPGISSSPANRTIFLLNVAIGLGGTIGLSRLIRSKKLLYQKIVYPFLLLGIVLGGLWGVVGFSLKVFPLFVQELSFWQVAFRNLILPTLIFLALLALFLVYYWQKISKKLFLLGIIFILSFELFRSGWKFNSFSDPKWFFPAIKETEFLQETAGNYRIEGAISPNMKMAYSLTAVSGYEILIPRITAEFLSVCNEGAGSGISHPVGRYAALNHPISRCGQIYGVKYLLTNYDGPPEENVARFDYQEETKRIWEENKSVILEINNTFPRAFLVDDYEVVADRALGAEKIVAIDSDFSLTSKIILFEEPLFRRNGSISLDSEVKIVDYQPQRVILETSANKEALLFLSDAYYPGWKAFVDGEQAKIYQANYAFRAVVVPKGEHKIIFNYQPDSFHLGVAVSLSTFLLLTSFLGFFFIKNHDHV